MSLDTTNIRFFEKEEKTFIAGDRTFNFPEPDTTGDNHLVVPFGLRISQDKEFMTVQLDPSQCDLFLKMEENLLEKLKTQSPEFMTGMKRFRSVLYGDSNNLVTFRISDRVSWNFYNIKKACFEKGKKEQVLPGSKVCVSFVISHPWSSNNGNYGFNLFLNEVIVYNIGERAVTEKPKSLKEQLEAQSKKRKRIMQFKEQDEDEDED